MATQRDRRLILAQIEAREKIEDDCTKAARAFLRPQRWHRPAGYRCSVCHHRYRNTARAGACCPETKDLAHTERRRAARQRKAAGDVKRHRNSQLLGD